MILLYDGEMISPLPTVFGHNYFSDNLEWALNLHIRARKLGKVIVEAPYVLVYNSEWVRGLRVPDVMIVLRERQNSGLRSTRGAPVSYKCGAPVKCYPNT